MDAQVLAFLSLLLGGGSGLYLIITTLISKKAKTPSDQLAAATWSVKLYEDQAREAKADKAVNEATIGDLREYIATLEQNARDNFAKAIEYHGVIEKLNIRILELEQRNAEKDAKIREYDALRARVLNKLKNGMPVTVSDIIGEPVNEEASVS